jgi:septum formation protein
MNKSSSLNCPIILASSSPRRIELLKLAGLNPIVKRPDINEDKKRNETPKQMVARLSREKAEAILPQALWEFGMAVLISADTTVVTPNGKSVLGKPANERDAFRMLKAISGKTHLVHTGYCILAAAREHKMQRIVRVVTTRVTMARLNDDSIRRYISTGESMDKAGAYAAQGIGMALIEKISGSYTNVVGLPITEVMEDLNTMLGIQYLSGYAQSVSP